MKPRVLFFDISLHKNDATGITLSNLFASWPKENLFMISEPDRLALSKEQGYPNLYSLGSNEITHRFPISFAKRIKNWLKPPMKESSAPDAVSAPVATEQSSEIGLLSKMIKRLGLHYYFFQLSISDSLEKWIKQAEPDFLYGVLSTRHSIKFALELQRKFRKPLIIHILDDWPMTIGTDTYFPKYWNRIINQELTQLLASAHRKVAISEKMAVEYADRFGGSWTYFHNPVDVSKWKPYQKQIADFKKSTKIRIAYFGRFGRANDEAIRTFIKAVKRFESTQYQVEFCLYTQISVAVKSELSSEKVIIRPFIQNHLVPEEISKYDFLFLPISFNEEDVKFARLSIPTKFSEYLISGVPTILMAPPNCAVTEFAQKYQCAYRLESDAEPEICRQLEILFNDLLLQQKIGSDAIEIANEKFERINVCNAFMEIFK